MRLAVAVAYLLCFPDCVPPKYRVRPDALVQASGAEVLKGSRQRVLYRFEADDHYMRFAILNFGSVPLRIRPGLASLTSAKCAIAFGEVDYVEGSGVQSFDEMDAQLFQRFQTKRALLFLDMDDSIHTELTDRSRELIVPKDGFLGVIYDLRGIRPSCAPMKFKVSGEPGFSLAATLIERGR